MLKHSRVLAARVLVRVEAFARVGGACRRVLCTFRVSWRAVLCTCFPVSGRVAWSPARAQNVHAVSVCIFACLHARAVLRASLQISVFISRA